MKYFFPFLLFFTPFASSSQIFNQVMDLDHNVVDFKIDDNNNVFLLGTFSTIIDADPGPGGAIINTNGNNDICLVKLDSAGNFQWVKQIGGTGSDAINEFEIDTSGNLILAGTFAATCDLDPGAGVVNYTAAGNGDIFILKLDNNGNYLNSFVITGPQTERVDEVDLSIDNDIYITGNFVDNVDFDPSGNLFIVSSPGNYNFYVAKYSANGDLKWANGFGSAANENSPRMTVDKDENVIVGGYFQMDFDANPGPAVYTISESLSDTYLISLDSLGQLNWGYSLIGSQLGEIILDMDADDSGDFYAAGCFRYGIDFDPFLIQPQSISTGDKDAFVARYNTIGSLEWVYQINGSQTSQINDIVLSHDRIYITGEFHAEQNSNPSDPSFAPIVSEGLTDAFILCLRKNGQFLWQKIISGSDYQMGYVIALDSKDNLFNSGGYKGISEFNPYGGPSFTLNNPGTGLRTYFSKFNYDSCYSFKVKVDSLKNIGCVQNGYASVSPYGGYSPYQFSWNTTPIINDSICTFTIPGIYSYTVSDSINCQQSGSILISEPNAISGFDLEINLAFHPVTDDDISLIAFNDGCNLTSGEYSLILDTLTSFDYSIPLPDQNHGDTLIWSFTNINYDSGYTTSLVDIDLNGQIGDTFCFNVMVNPVSGDGDSSNNYKTYCFPVLSSYDPNDKQVYPPGVCTPHYTLNHEPLTYTIRFQNTGNAEAYNIFILDTLDPNLDMNMFRIVSSSHSLVTEILPGNVVKFKYDNIHLPDYVTNEPLSHGYVIYEIMPLPTTPDNTLIENTSYIYFDSNPAIITNTVFNTLVSVIPNCFLSNSDNEHSDFCTLFPNPASNEIFIYMDQGGNQTTIELFNLNGQILKSSVTSSQLTNFSLHDLANGMYFVQIKSGTEHATFKIVKE